MHITAGKHRKRRIETPDGKDIRPTSSMVREAIFNVVMHAEPAGDDDSLLQGQVVADICCGCGTLGLEALSRGAGNVVFVDQNRKSLDLTKENVTSLDEDENASFIKADATMLPPARMPVSVVFLDPPYSKDFPNRMLKSLVKSEWLKPNAMVVVEQAIHDEVPEHPKLALIKQKTYGKTQLAFYRYQA